MLKPRITAASTPAMGYFLDRELSGIFQSLQRLATGWTVRGSNPVGVTFSAPLQTGPGTHPTSYTMGTGLLPGVKRGVDHPLHLAPRLKEE